MCVFIESIKNTWQWIKQYLSKMVQKNRRQNQQDQGTRAKTSTDYLLSQYFQILKTVFNSDELSTSKSLLSDDFTPDGRECTSFFQDLS